MNHQLTVVLHVKTRETGVSSPAVFTFSARSASFFPPPPALLLLPPLPRPLLRVHALVSAQVPQGAAGVAALGAAVGFLPGVGAGVALQVDELGRGVGAGGAAVRLVAVVRPHVALQVVGVPRGEGAQRAGEGPGGGVLLALLPVGLRRTLRLGRGLALQALLTGETVELRPQVQAHT